LSTACRYFSKIPTAKEGNFLRTLLQSSLNISANTTRVIPFWNGALLSICLTSGCFQGFCDHCTTAKRQNHRHPLANVGFIKRNLVAGVGDFRKMKCDECNARECLPLPHRPYECDLIITRLTTSKRELLLALHWNDVCEVPGLGCLHHLFEEGYNAKKT